MRTKLRKMISVCLAVIMILSILTIAPISVSAANNTQQTAKSISTNTSYTDRLSAYGEQDFFSFSLSNSSKVNINFKHTLIDSSSTYWYAALYNENGDELVKLSVVGNKTNLSSSNVGIPAGKYYIKVYQNNYSNVDYTIKINSSSESYWETEVNNSYDYGDAISLNKEYSGSLAKYDDIDFYKFYVSSASKVSINFKHSLIDSSSTYWYAALYNENGDELVKLSVVGNKTNLSSSNVGIPAGKYYIKVYQNNYSNVDYTIKINSSSESYWETEVNNSYDYGDTISLNKEYSGSLAKYGDVDYYRLSLSSAARVSINFKHSSIDSSSTYWYAVLYNENGDALTKLSVAGNKTNLTSSNVEIPAGKYFIKVYQNNYSNIDYSFSIITSSSTATNPTLSTPQITKLENTASGIKISWNKVSGAYGYRLYYKYPGQDWKRFKDTTSTSFTDTGVSAGRVETYTIRCIDSNGNTISGYNSSGWSKKYEPVAPTITNLENTSSGIKITWNKVAGVYGYRLYYKYPGQDWKRFKDTTATSFTDTGVSAGRIETYTIRCIDKNGNTISGYYSSGWSKKYEPVAPTITKLENTSSGVKITWNKVAGVYGYRLYYKYPGQDWKRFKDTTATSFTDTGVKVGRTETYTIRCIDKNGNTISGYYPNGWSITYR